MSNGIGVYKISLPSGSVYVGMTTKSFELRWRGHRKELLNGRHPCTGLVHAYRKYGIDALSFEVLEEVPTGTVDSVILKKEQEWWDRIKAQGVNIYNGRPSGTGSVHHTEETKARIAAAMKGRIKLRDPLVCPKCSKSFIPNRKIQKLCSRQCASATNAVTKKKLFLTYDELVELYWTREMTCKEIGEIYDVGHPAVEALMRKLAVPKRTVSEAIKLSRKKSAMG